MSVYSPYLLHSGDQTLDVFMVERKISSRFAATQPFNLPLRGGCDKHHYDG